MVGSGGTSFWEHYEIKTHQPPDFVPPGRQNQTSFYFISVNFPQTEGKKIA
jgi:hypothetical protein